MSVAHSLNIDDVAFSFSRASLVFGASQNIRGDRATALGWKPRPVVLEDWADEGIAAMFARM
jgi:hypothetical protein